MCTFVCKRFCFNFAATAHTHSHTHTHILILERCSFNDIGVFVCKTQKTRPAPPPPEQYRSYDWDSGPLRLPADALCTSGRRVRGSRGRSGVAECVDLTLLPANDTIDAAQPMPMPCTHTHTRAYICTYGTS